MENLCSIVRFHKDWSDDLQQLRELRPKNSSAFLLGWCVNDSKVEGGVPSGVAEAVSRAIVKLGFIAFRWGYEDLPPGETILLSARSLGIANRAINRLTGIRQSDLIMTKSPTVALSLFEFNWEMQGQAAFIFKEQALFDEAAQIELSIRRNWSDYDLASAGLVFLAPAVDGDGMMFAGHSPSALRPVRATLKHELVNAGFTIENDDEQ